MKVFSRLRTWIRSIRRRDRIAADLHREVSDWVEELASEGVTSGCGNGNYCPGAPVTRAQMAVFLLKTLLGSSYVPPPATGIFGERTSPNAIIASCTISAPVGPYLPMRRGAIYMAIP